MRRYIFLLFTILSLSCLAQEKSAIEMQADRVIIYPGRMELTGEESLLDVLMMYPDLMQTGFDDVLKNYSLLVDKVAMNGDTRVLCAQLKAKLISRIQICDNTAVAYGTVGMGRVIDINMKRMEEGTHGFVAMQGATDAMATPSAQIELGSKNTDVFANLSYTHQNKYENVRNNEYFTLHVTNWFGKRDKLYTYITQQNLNTKYDTGNKNQTKKYLGYAGYAHTFNDKGTKLVLFAGYQYQDAPKTTLTADGRLVKATSVGNTVGKIEFTTPLYRGIDLLSGWLGCWTDYNYEHNTTSQDVTKRTELDYRSNYQDFYAQLNYRTGIWLFTVGDRIKLFHYGYKDMEHNDVRNNIQASIIAKPGRHHQVQAGYFRKFTNPSYSITTPLTEEEWMLKKGKLTESNIDEIKLAYIYCRKNVNLNLTTSYFGMENANNVGRTHLSSTLKARCLLVNVGINYYNVMNGDDYATFNLRPSLLLPFRWQVSAHSIFFTKSATLTRDEQVYGALSVSKQIGKHWNLMAQWHDIFSKRYSAVMAEVKYGF